MDKNELINSHMPLAVNLAKKKKRSVSRNIYYEELESAAYRGLVDAAQNYNQVKGEFKYYAAPRILGEMEDYLRELQWGGRSKPINVCSLDANLCTKEDNAEAVADAFKYVPEEVRNVFVWHYADGITLEKIGSKLNLTRSGVLKMITRYKEQIRKRCN